MLGSERGPRKYLALIFFLHQAPLTSVCERSLNALFVNAVFYNSLEVKSKCLRKWSMW